MTFDLKGKTAVVCGSTGGIGLASAFALAGAGASVVLVARDAAKLAGVAAALPGGPHQWLAADFSHPAAVKDAVAGYVSSGIAQILVNNTGGPPPGKASEADIEAFRVAFNNHLVNNHILATALLPGMRKSGYGRIINIISTSVKQPLPNLGVSNTVRAAVANWAKTLAGELAAEGITVNNVLPGATETGRLQAIIAEKAQRTGKSEEAVRAEMIREIPAGRLGTPEEIAAAVLFLASPAASYVNGINLTVDGGRTGCL